MTAGIYGIMGPNGYVFVGQSLDIERRFYAHYWQLRGNKHPCGNLQNAWNENPSFRFRFMVYGEVSPFNSDRYILEQHFLEQAKHLYNESKKVIRTCAYYPKEMITDAMSRFVSTPRVHFLTPRCEWESLKEANYSWCACDAGKLDDNWFVGVIMDTEKWNRHSVAYCTRFEMLAYNPLEEFKRLGKDKWTGFPTVRKAFLPYVFCRLTKGYTDLYRTKEGSVPISFMFSGQPISIPANVIDDMQQQEDVGAFISTERERENAIRHENLKGASIVRTDGEKAVMFKNGETFEVLLTDIRDLYRKAS